MRGDEGRAEQRRASPRSAPARRGCCSATRRGAAATAARLGRRRRGSRRHLDAHRARERAAEHVDVVAEADEQRARRTAACRRPRSRRRARCRARPGSAASPGRSRRCARRCRALAGARGRPARWSGAPRSRGPRVGIGSPCGSTRRVAELGGDQLLELLGEDVLEHLGLGVHAIPRHAERLGEVELEQAVVADAPRARRARRPSVSSTPL